MSTINQTIDSNFDKCIDKIMEVLPEMNLVPMAQIIEGAKTEALFIHKRLGDSVKDLTLTVAKESSEVLFEAKDKGLIERLHQFLVKEASDSGLELAVVDHSEQSVKIGLNINHETKQVQANNVATYCSAMIFALLGCNVNW